MDQKENVHTKLEQKLNIHLQNEPRHVTSNNVAFDKCRLRRAFRSSLSLEKSKKDGKDQESIQSSTVNSEIFARVLFLRNFPATEFRENKTHAK